MTYSKSKIEQIWEKGKKITGKNPDEWRKDKYGNIMKFSQRGKNGRDKLHGWEIDHIKPNGGDGINNLQPLHWKNNVAKQDKVNFKRTKKT